jgi:hypothetical protein
VAEFDLNLSTRPFPAYRLVNFALAAILAVLLVISGWQAVGWTRFARLSRSIRTVETNQRVEAETLGKRVAELEAGLDRPEAAAKLNEVGFLNHLIARKNLSWTRLLADLENMVPNNVHLVSLAPQVNPNGGITLRFDLEGHSIRDISEFIHRVEKSPVFQTVIVSSEQKHGSGLNPSSDVEVVASAIYLPERDNR